MIDTNLPVQLTSFVGRERELAALQRLLAAATAAFGAYAGGLAWLACALAQVAAVPLILRRREVEAA